MPEKVKHKGPGSWLFLLFVLITYGVFSLFKPEDTVQALAFFMQVMQQVVPVLVLVFILLFIANLILEPKWIRQYVGKESGIRGWIAALSGGILSIGPIYAWYAVLSELQEKGMRTALIATFLYSRAVKLPLLPLIIHYFGLAYTLVLSLYLIIFAAINGILVEKVLSRKS